ncbi:MAG: hypothetical protein KC643_29840, partial [Nitrospira sp.]|nr:hypothetical protein [Nitrospira sp.]
RGGKEHHWANTAGDHGKERGFENQLVQIGWLLQRMSETMVTPEVSEFSFVRQKLIEFMKGVDLHGHQTHIETEFRNLNGWVESYNTRNLSKKAFVVAVVAALFGFFSLFSCNGKSIEELVKNNTERIKALEDQQEQLGKLEGHVTTTSEAVEAQQEQLGKLEGHVTTTSEAVEAQQEQFGKLEPQVMANIDAVQAIKYRIKKIEDQVTWIEERLNGLLSTLVEALKKFGEKNTDAAEETKE